jgi:dolichol-phosphate mannosyltransferase|tara:strand:- start:543 stop:1295 length:753 start_codon:yes stop_codon:yes gene_type:complete
MFKNKDYSIILPTFNEVGHIEKLINDITEIFTKKQIKFEILVVDDVSLDGTIDLIKKISLKNNNLNLLLRINEKKSLVRSIQKGIDSAKYQKIIWMDADYSHPPEYIENFINLNANEDYDVIVCSRFLEESQRYYDGTDEKPKGIDKLSLVLNKICQKFISDKFKDYTSGFICIDSQIIKEKKLSGYYGDYFITLISSLIKENRKIKEIPFVEKERATGNSKTTGNKFDFLIKCYFYLWAIIKSLSKNLF